LILKKLRLDQILFNRKLAETKSKAQAMIMAGQVFVEGKVINKSGININTNSEIEIKNLGPVWVSRGAFKLIKALDVNNINLENKVCMDLGASTGGFTDVLIQRGAKKVYAVDVGTNQLHEKLKKNKKVLNLEKINARYITQDLINELIELLVCDVSFISLKKVILPNLGLLKNNSTIIALIKPQFESKKNETKKGIVKDIEIHSRICEEIKTWFAHDCNCEVLNIIESPIKGPKGNIEFLLTARYQK
jgi:23S rRNA (cytidine1920-2'-O)/16S rRNA (cytidine1409-2'-O)-methyltransferase